MRRALVVAASLLLLTLVISPADAGTVVSHSSLPSPLALVGGECGSLPGSTGTLTHVNGPDQPPLGAGSLRVRTGPSTLRIGITDPLLVNADTLTAFKVAHYEPQTNAPFVTITFDMDPDGTGAHSDLLIRNLPSSGSGATWQTEDLVQTTSLFFYDDDIPVGEGSYADYVSAHPNAILKDLQYVATNCAPGGTDESTYIDDWVVGVSGTNTTYNFEAPAATLIPSVSTSTVTAGRGVIVKVAARTAGGSPIVNHTVKLMAKTYPNPTYRLLTTRQTNAAGVALLTERPLAATTYKWVMDPVDYAPATSQTRAVAVRTKLTANVKDRTLKKSQKLVVKGKTYKPRPGSKIQLRRKTSHGSKLVQKVTVAGDGTYRFKHTLPTGKQHVYVHIGGGNGELAGNSPTVAIRVRH
jgi:hypothetical protein